MAEMDEVLREFLVESYENMDRLDRDLVALEERPTDREILGSIFRTIHTIKGTCGFLGFARLEKVTHVGENLLARLRDGTLTVDAPITTALLALVDAVRAMLKHIEAHGNEGVRDDAALVAELVRLNDASTPSTPPVAIHSAPSTPAAPTPTPVVDLPAPPPTEATAPAATSVVHGTSAKSGDDSKVSDSNVRVDVGLLDKLMNLVGELVLARNQILQHAIATRDGGFAATTQRLNLITTELQEGVMKTRMQPIGNVWNKFPRVVRDLAVLCGKQVRVEMEGKETELDRTIIEAIKDPLTHIVRNSVDHGIETAEERRRKGKPQEGRILLRAYHEGGQVNIEIADDGGGVRAERVKAKAVEKGLITSEAAARMSDREAVTLIFLPGFSTAEKVTNVSGRGVGMDVVKTNIEKIGGAVDVTSRPDAGTTIRIKIPLTLAIIPALLVGCDGERFAIPQASLLELVRLDGEAATWGIESIRGTPVYRLRGNLLPLVRLNTVLGLPERRGDAVNIVVLQADGRPFGLVVDAISDTEEIVVKPLGKLLKGLPCYAGAAIMGDGKVALILDVLGIARAGRVGGDSRDRAARQEREKPAKASTTTSLLLVAAAGGRRMAVPLDLVARLEEFPRHALESAAGRPVVQYRDGLLPLVDLAERFASDAPQTGGTLRVVVHHGPEGAVGFIVEQILDIVDVDVASAKPAKVPGLRASVVVLGRVTDVLDVPALVQGALETVEI